MDYEVRQALLGHRMPGMTASYSHGGPAWDQKLREAVTQLDQAFKMSYGLSYDRKAVVIGSAQVAEFSGEPPGTRTQGPRLKSSNRWSLINARYCNGFPNNVSFRSVRPFLLVPVFSITSIVSDYI